MLGLFILGKPLQRFFNLHDLYYPSDMRHSIQSILNDRTSGASTLFHCFLNELEHLDEKEFEQTLSCLQQTFPAMAVWVYLEQYFSEHPFSNQSIRALKTITVEEKRRVLDAASDRLSDFSSFLTLSRSSLVEAFLLQLGSRKRINVVCSESLPAHEGRELTHSLNANGVITRCVQDWTLIEEVHHVDVILLGADWITDAFVVNKQGSKAITEKAIRERKPVVFLAEKFKKTGRVDFQERWCYQDWSEGASKKQIKVFDIIPRRTEMIIP